MSPVSLIGQHAAILLHETVERERERIERAEEEESEENGGYLLHAVS